MQKSLCTKSINYFVLHFNILHDKLCLLAQLDEYKYNNLSNYNLWCCYGYCFCELKNNNVKFYNQYPIDDINLSSTILGKRNLFIYYNQWFTTQLKARTTFEHFPLIWTFTEFHLYLRYLQILSQKCSMVVIRGTMGRKKL